LDKNTEEGLPGYLRRNQERAIRPGLVMAETGSRKFNGGEIPQRQRRGIDTGTFEESRKMLN